MRTEIKGLAAGLAATVVLSILMLIKASLGLLPQVNAIQMLAGVAAGAGLPAAPATGWAIHLIIGIVLWGLLFAWVGTRFPGGRVIQGILFAIAAWILMMIIVMPIAGAGLFGMNIGIGAPVATLVLHIIFGAVLGWTYQALDRRPAAPTAQ